jgi:DNA-binding PadR family transcriptional regulator
MTNNDSVARHFFNGFMRLHILYHAAKEPIYGAEIAEELERHGYRLSPGTLYPTLHAMQAMGLLHCRTQFVDGRRRKYYRATALGRKTLGAAREKLLELVAEVLEDRDEPFQQIRRRQRAGAGSDHVSTQRPDQVSPRGARPSHRARSSRRST